MKTNPILDDPILDDNTPVLQPTPKFIAKSIQKIKDFGKWLLDYIPPNLKVVDEALESFKHIIKKLYNKRAISFEFKESKSALKKFEIEYRIDGKDGFIIIYFWLTPSSLYKPSGQQTTV